MKHLEALRHREVELKEDNADCDPPRISLGSQVTDLRIVVGPLTFVARLQEKRAPQTCAAFRELLPYRQKIIHARWSGEATWIPLGDFSFGVGFENHKSHPSPGQILLYPGGYSETEILFPYGATTFASELGQLAGNHFATVVRGQESLSEMGRMVLWEGAKDVVFDLMPQGEV